MRFNLRLAHAGLIFTCGPLLFVIVFAVGLTVLLYQAEAERQREAYFKAVAAQCVKVQSDFYRTQNHLFKYALTSIPSYLEEYEDAKATIRSDIARLKELVERIPELSRRADDLENHIIEAYQYTDEAREWLERGSRVAAIARLKNLKSVLEDISVKFDEIERYYARLQEQDPHLKTRFRDLVPKFLLAGVVLSITGTAVLSILFSKGIVKKLAVLSENSMRLAENKPLLPVLSGKDEIAQLDATFHEMAQKRQELERLRSEFVAMVSHDLRTPLTSIGAALDLLAQGAGGDLSADARHLLAVAERNSSRLLKLVNDLLHIEKLEAGKMDMHCEQVDVNQLIDGALEAVAGFAGQEGVHLESERSSLCIRADADRLAQVLVNLLSNAVKFSPKGATVSVSVREIPGWCEIRVADQGRGIPESMQQAIFERFKQVDKSDAKRRSGVGLGLPICKSIVEQHGGEIGVESVVGKGSVFWFRVPI